MRFVSAASRLVPRFCSSRLAESVSCFVADLCGVTFICFWSLRIRCSIGGNRLLCRVQLADGGSQLQSQIRALAVRVGYAAASVQMRANVLRSPPEPPCSVCASSAKNW